MIPVRPRPWAIWVADAATGNARQIWRGTNDASGTVLDTVWQVRLLAPPKLRTSPSVIPGASPNSHNRDVQESNNS
jgi:hypothetical protein